MSELITAAYTALLGVIVFVVGQTLQRFILEPIAEQRKIIGEISYALIYYRNIAGGSLDSPDEIKKVRYELRSLSARLRSTLWSIPFYWTLSLVGVIPKRKSIEVSYRALIQWSNSIGDNVFSLAEAIDVLEIALKIEDKFDYMEASKRLLKKKEQRKGS